MSDRIPVRFQTLDAQGNPSGEWVETWGLVVTTRDPITDEPEGLLSAQTDGHSLILRGDEFPEDDRWYRGPYCPR